MQIICENPFSQNKGFLLVPGYCAKLGELSFFWRHAIHAAARRAREGPPKLNKKAHSGEPGIPVQSHINRKSFLLLGENFREEDFAPGLFGPEAFEKVPDHSVLAVHSDVLTGRDTRNLI